jgi:hypothetical protein
VEGLDAEPVLAEEAGDAKADDKSAKGTACAHYHEGYQAEGLTPSLTYRAVAATAAGVESNRVLRVGLGNPLHANKGKLLQRLPIQRSARTNLTL